MDPISTKSTASFPESPSIAKWWNDLQIAIQYYLDRSTPHTLYRWIGTLAAASIYVLRVYYMQGFYVISYGLGIYLPNLLIGLMSPIADPEIEALDGATLPTSESDEFKPFIRRLPEFKFWDLKWFDEHGGKHRLCSGIYHHLSVVSLSGGHEIQTKYLLHSCGCQVLMALIFLVLAV